MEKELENQHINLYIKVPEALLYEISREIIKLYAEKVGKGKKKKSNCKTIGYLKSEYMGSGGYAEQRLIVNKIKGVSYVSLPYETIHICSKDTILGVLHLRL